MPRKAVYVHLICVSIYLAEFRFLLRLSDSRIPALIRNGIQVSILQDLEKHYVTIRF